MGLRAVLLLARTQLHEKDIQNYGDDMSAKTRATPVDAQADAQGMPSGWPQL